MENEELEKETRNLIPDEEKAKADYNANDIQVLEGLEAVRKRPGMYIGSTSSTGLHHCVWEIVDNAIDEALAGYCDTIHVTINKGNTITVKDNGRGIPVGIVAKSGKSAVETVYTILHAGGKFGEGGGYKVSGGLHGVGASVVNALSEWLEVTVHKDGGIYYIKFANGGHTVEPLKQIGTCDDTGTIVTFKPDASIFKETTVFDYSIIRDRIRQMAFLNKGVRIIVKDDRGEEPVEDDFCYEGGLKEYVTYLNRNKESQDNQYDVIYCEGKQDGISVEIAMQYNDSYTSMIYSFCNNINTADGGTHEEGFRLALTRVINKYGRANKFLKDNDESLTQDDVREGLTAIISIKHPNPQYEGQTKGKLGNSEVRAITSNIFGEQLERYLNENPKAAKLIMAKVTLAANARIAAKKARETTRKNGMDITSLPGKLADCSSKNAEECELYIVEGNSAGGSAKNGRDRKTQAILPLRGKILNVEKAQTKRIFANAEIGNMIIAIGGGYGNDFDVSKIRYHKIVIMTDADVDGSHIRILLLTFFYRYMKPLIEDGRLFVALPPLFKIDFGKGKEVKYAYNIEEMQAMTKGKKCEVQRYKGLGEMNADQLCETTMQPGTRTLIRVNIEDAQLAEKRVSVLMGDEVAPRKEWIEENVEFSLEDDYKI